VDDPRLMVSDQHWHFAPTGRIILVYGKEFEIVLLFSFDSTTTLSASA